MPVVINGTTGISGVDGSAGTPSYQGGDTNTGIFYPAADTIAFAEGGAEIARFDSSGNLGINNTSPAVLASTTQVAIKANVNGNSLFVAQNSNGLTTAKFGFQFTGSVDNPVIGSSTNHPLVFLTNDTERMRIASDGIIAMGTTDTSNTTRLKVQSGSTTNRATSAQLSVQRNSSSTQYEGICFVSGVAQSAYILRVPNSDDLTFGFDAGGSTTERMRITSGGDLLVGTTSNYGTARTSINNSGTVLGLYCSGASGQPAFVIGKESNDASTSQVLMQFLYNNGSAGLGQINGNGGSQAAFGSYSDIRLKENVVDLAPQLENIIALRPVEFDYKDGSGHQTGFIAQEIQNVFPEAVSVGHNEMLTVTGWNKTEAILVKAIQEQQAMIEELKAKVAALEK